MKRDHQVMWTKYCALNRTEFNAATTFLGTEKKVLKWWTYVTGWCWSSKEWYQGHSAVNQTNTYRYVCTGTLQWIWSEWLHPLSCTLHKYVPHSNVNALHFLDKHPVVKKKCKGHKIGVTFLSTASAQNSSVNIYKVMNRIHAGKQLKSSCKLSTVAVQF